jgi:hypothetical protein
MVLNTLLGLFVTWAIALEIGEIFICAPPSLVFDPFKMAMNMDKCE